MVKIISSYPTPENTELFQTYNRTSPQLYSSILTTDKYLVRFASNIWNVQFPNCTFHPPTNSIHLPIQFDNDLNNSSFYLDLPYQKIISNSLSFNNQYLNPLTNSITLESLCEIYFLAENIIIKLTPESSNFNQLNNQISFDGLIFSIPYNDIKIHKIKDNLTKLYLFLKSNDNTIQELILYPLQRFPPQPLTSGIFQQFSNLTPLQSLQMADNAILEGTELSNKLIQYSNNLYNNQNLNNNINTSNSKILLSQNGYGDDDNYDDFKIDGNLNDNSDLQSMHVEMVGGFNSTGVKRSRRDSDDVMMINNNNINNNNNRVKYIAPLKNKRIYSPGI